MIAQLHRDPAHLNREHWNCEHITKPEPSVFAGEAGKRRRITYLMNNLLIGDETLLEGGLKVYREQKTVYHVYQYFTLLATGTLNQALAYILDGQPCGVKKPKRAKRERAELLPSRKSPYRCVVYNRRCGSWYAQIGYQTHVYKLPHRVTAEEAARDYDAFVIEHGLSRPLNFPLEQENAA